MSTHCHFCFRPYYLTKDGIQMCLLFGSSFSDPTCSTMKSLVTSEKLFMLWMSHFICHLNFYFKAKKWMFYSLLRRKKKFQTKNFESVYNFCINNVILERRIVFFAIIGKLQPNVIKECVLNTWKKILNFKFAKAKMLNVFKSLSYCSKVMTFKNYTWFS